MEIRSTDETWIYVDFAGSSSSVLIVAFPISVEEIVTVRNAAVVLDSVAAVQRDDVISNSTGWTPLIDSHPFVVVPNNRAVEEVHVRPFFPLNTIIAVGSNQTIRDECACLLDIETIVPIIQDATTAHDQLTDFMRSNPIIAVVHDIAVFDRYGSRLMQMKAVFPILREDRLLDGDRRELVELCSITSQVVKRATVDRKRQVFGFETISTATDVTAFQQAPAAIPPFDHS